MVPGKIIILQWHISEVTVPIEYVVTHRNLSFSLQCTTVPLQNRIRFLSVGLHDLLRPSIVPNCGLKSLVWTRPVFVFASKFDWPFTDLEVDGLVAWRNLLPGSEALR